MKRHFTISNHGKEITFSDWDNENEIYIEMGTEQGSTDIIYLDEGNVISLFKHIQYLLDRNRVDKILKSKDKTEQSEVNNT